MTSEWSQLETGNHQDHVIAHVVGTTVLGFFVLDEAAHLLLDIGFIWTIYADTEMALLPQAVAINEFPVDAAAKSELAADATLLHDGREPSNLKRMTPPPVECLIKEVTCQVLAERRRVLLQGEEASLVVETLLATGEIHLAVGL
jgi:hypothetical protein